MKVIRVQAGDTIAKIAAREQVRKTTLVHVNERLANTETYLVPGEELKIPAESGGAPGHPCETEFGWQELEQFKHEWRNNGEDWKQIGSSCLGRPLYSFGWGKGKGKVLFSGGWHGNEWLTSWFLVHFLKTLQKKTQQKETWYGYHLSKLEKNLFTVWVPLVNPDGVELVQEGAVEATPLKQKALQINDGLACFRHWSANIRGVDLNHQWPAGWEKEASTSPQRPWPRHYGGAQPLTEPEAIAVYELVKSLDFQSVYAFHSQGQEIFWGYDKQEPPKSADYAKRLAQASSYQPIRNAGSGAGFKDWFINAYKKPGFTIEVGKGINPLPFEASSEIWRNNVPLVLEALAIAAEEAEANAK
ncbi:M14 family metallopeptidase [Salsuginibacillus kocurii]|uniref:M14 family metallopeptidase n=1 Tax=Salsuginibacillus kocurii TaxID=427078 RepID=UPI0003778756|nr:M14 family metallopeptidase [Salsuginibacillus kocurii]